MQCDPYSDVSGIHVVVLLFVTVGRRWRDLFFLQEFFAIERACGVQLEPRGYTVKIEAVIIVARQLDYKWILVYAPPGQLNSSLLWYAAYLQETG
jgi:hypothetical protein